MSDLIEAYAGRLKGIGRSPLTISTRCRVLRHANSYMLDLQHAAGVRRPEGLDTACPDDLVAYLGRLNEAWTRATYYSHLNGYYKTMVKAGRLRRNPMLDVDRPKAGDRIPDPVSDAELAAAMGRSPDQPWRTAVILAAYAGLRCCELVMLDRDDITRDHVHVRRGKGGKGRYIPTHPIVWDLFASRTTGLLVTSSMGLPIGAERLSSIQHEHWCAVGLPTVHMHRFRHWFGTTLSDQGVGIEVIRELMGHESIETTRGYVKVSVTRQRAALVALPSVGGHEPVSTRLVPPAAEAA